MSTPDELRNCAAYVESASNAIEGADRGRELARLARKAAGDLDAYAKTAAIVGEIDQRVVAVLMWLDERARNSRSYGSHADAYEIAARRLREALGAPENPALPAEAASAAASTKNPSKEKR
jgi:hypothetical protein